MSGCWRAMLLLANGLSFLVGHHACRHLLHSTLLHSSLVRSSFLHSPLHSPLHSLCPGSSQTARCFPRPQRCLSHHSRTPACLLRYGSWRVHSRAKRFVQTHTTCATPIFFSFSFSFTNTHTHTLTHSLLHSFTPSLLHSFTPSHTCADCCVCCSRRNKKRRSGKRHSSTALT